uniref:C2H2-type domain-containing protein n=1 Tax=Kalanchoe fedtschenkoi TaxID=63787 RepID=A0A7N0UY21_KALFE
MLIKKLSPPSRMPRAAPWFSSIKKSLQCKTDPSDVHDPKARTAQLSAIATRSRPSTKSGCSRTISNLRDVIHGSKRHLENKPAVTCSPRSIQSSEFLNPIAHEVILTGSGCHLKISGSGSGETDHRMDHQSGADCAPVKKTMSRRHNLFELVNNGGGDADVGRRSGPKSSRRRPSETRFDEEDGGCCCHKCGEKFSEWEALEAHHLSRHAITELVEGDSSRKIVEIICRTSWLKSEEGCGRIEKIFKINNMSKTLAQFEEYRELIKGKASKLPKKHPRCLADGNELLRFHGTTVACPLGQNGCTTLCVSEKCSICRIIKDGFSARKELNGGVGVFTASTSGRALQSVEKAEGGDEEPVRKALVICRVIAGRVHKPLENIQDIAGQSGFDSLAGKSVGVTSNIEDLYLLNPKALLPCFVVICKS